MLYSIIIPCYNEEARIEHAIYSVCYYMNHIYGISDYEVIIVDDGSNDRTAELAQGIASVDDHVIVIKHKENKGKGGAVKTGIENSDGHILFYMDCDMSTNLDAIRSCVGYLQMNHFEHFFLMGSRKLSDSRIYGKRSLIRDLMSKVCISYVNSTFCMNYTDTQCGFKCFDRETGFFIAAHQTIYGFAFDLEYLLKANSFMADIKEIPVKWHDSGMSSVHPVKSSIDYIKSVKKLSSIVKFKRIARR